MSQPPQNGRSGEVRNEVGSLGRRAVREIDASSVTTYSNRGIAMAGMILGIIGTVFLVVVVVGLVVLVASIMVRSRQP